MAGARLCSDRNCTHIIPPSIEYLWKRCALCRLRARSSRKFDDTSLSQEVDSRVQIAVRRPSIYYTTKPNSKAVYRSFLSEINTYPEDVEALTVVCSCRGKKRYWIAINVLQGVHALLMMALPSKLWQSGRQNRSQPIRLVDF